jgi:hypothetical protein
MIVAIFSLAIILLLAGCAGLFSAINLVPTDLGFTYFQAGTTAMSAGCMVLALGFAVKVLNRSLQRLAVPEPVQATQVEPVIDLPSLPAIETLPAHASTSLAPVVAVAGATVAAGVILAAAASHAAAPGDGEAGTLPAPEGGEPAITDKLVDDLERDLFTQTEALPEPEPVSSAPIATDPFGDFNFPLPEFAQHSPVEAGDIPVKAEADNDLPDVPASLKETGSIASALVDADGQDMTGLHARVPEPVQFDRERDALDPPLLPLPALPPLPIDPVLRSGSSQPGGPVAEESPAEALPPATTPAPGLIRDADFAAVADEVLPPLAPVSSLDVVGSYDSGGTRFTMYSDGSVVAAGSDGEQRFRSLDELRRHIDGGHA